MELICNSISKTYRNQYLALDNVHITMYPGIWGLLGANGAGKTTLMQILTTILQPDKEGTVSFNGVNINDDREKYRSIVGYVPQECGFPGHIRLKNLLFLLAQFKRIKYKDAEKQIDKLLDFF
jgi:ABC-2 type transport system ATP-binding protein